MSSSGFGAVELTAFCAELRRRKYSPGTIGVRERDVTALLAFLAGRRITRLQDVTADELEAYRLELTGRQCARATIESYLRSVLAFFGWLENTQRLFSNPAGTLKVRVAGEREQPVATEEEIRKLLAQPDTTTPGGVRDRALLETMYSTGALRSELLGLRIFDPDLEKGAVTVMGKGRKERVLPLGKRAVYWLTRYMREARKRLVKDRPDVSALWVSRCGGPLGAARVVQLVRGLAREAGIKTPLNLYGLRRACAMHLLSRGVHPVQVQLLLGHVSLKLLAQYLQTGVRQLMKQHNSRPEQATGEHKP